MRSEDPQHGELYDAFLEGLLAGVDVDPAVFLTQAGVHDEALLEKLQALREAANLIPPRADPALEAEAELPRERVGDYRLIRRLGQGGMGQVFLAEQESLGRQVALKLLHGGHFTTSQASLRFHREARSLARLRHPGVVTVFDFGVAEGTHFLAMDYLDGQDLSTLLQEHAARGEVVPTTTALRWAAELARALACVHEAGLLHRDVKPSNILITPQGHAVLVDFGLAAVAGEDGPTLTRSFLGSPAYASPEQVRGDGTLDARADVYALGATLYRCLSGELPFHGKDLEQLFHHILSAPPTPLRKHQAKLPREVELVVMHALEKKAAHRYQSARAFAEDLEALIDLRPIQVRPPSPWRRLRFWTHRHRASAAALATALLAMLVVVALYLNQTQERRHARLTRAHELFEQANQRLQAYLKTREEVAAETLAVQKMQNSLESAYLDRASLRELDRLEDTVREAELRGEREFNSVLDLLGQAEQLDPGLKDGDALRGRLYLARFRERVQAGDAVGSRFFLTQAERFQSPESLQTLLPPATLSLQVSPPGPFSLQIFRYREQAELQAGAEHRMVPVIDGPRPPDLLPGTWCLRVEEDMGDFCRGDLLTRLEGWPIEGSILVAEGSAKVTRGDRLLSVDGLPMLGAYELAQLRRGRAVDGDRDTPVPALRRFRFDGGSGEYELTAPDLASLGIHLATPEQMARAGNCLAERWRDGRRERLTLPEGLSLRVTTQPLFAMADAWLEFSEEAVELALQDGPTLLRLRRPGYEEQVVGLRADSGSDLSLELSLLPTGSTPPGFRHVVPRPFWPHPDFFLMEREVTSAEYLAFLNDPGTLEAIRRSPTPRYYPRSFRDAETGGRWPRDADGRFRLPPDWPATWPILGISWFDARDYAAWLSAEAAARGEAFRYRLPTLREFRIGARGPAFWDYPYGPRFRPNWSNSCFSRPIPAPEPVLSYPVDESLFGIYDTCGSALEWVDAWWDQARSERFTAGGSWAQGGSIPAKPTSGLGLGPQETSMETTFRLVAERR